MHDGYLNTYAFSKAGRKITLAPLSPSQLHKSKLRKNQEHSDQILTCREPLLNASQHEFEALKE